jgi:zinc transport system substrate-binding protein
MKSKIFYILIYLHLFLLQGNIFCEAEYITTIQPFKDILVNLIGNRAVVRQLVPAGVSPHTFEIKPSLFKSIGKSPVLFYGASNLDGWVLDIPHPNKIELIGLIPESQLLQFETNLHTTSDIIDPHFWHDPTVVKALLPKLCDTLIAIDPQGRSFYQENVKKFSKSLDSLVIIIKSELAGIQNQYLFLSHPFFLYYLHRFNFKVAGVIEFNPGSEPTPKKLKHFVDLANQYHVKAILTQFQLSDRPAKLVAESTNIKIIQLDPLGGLKFTRTYRELLLFNTRQLREGLQ